MHSTAGARARWSHASYRGGRRLSLPAIQPLVTPDECVGAALFSPAKVRQISFVLAL
jgi:hypothetical protein